MDIEKVYGETLGLCGVNGRQMNTVMNFYSGSSVFVRIKGVRI